MNTEARRLIDSLSTLDISAVERLAIIVERDLDSLRSAAERIHRAAAKGGTTEEVAAARELIEVALGSVARSAAEDGEMEQFAAVALAGMAALLPFVAAGAAISGAHSAGSKRAAAALDAELGAPAAAA